MQASVHLVDAKEGEQIETFFKFPYYTQHGLVPHCDFGSKTDEPFYTCNINTAP